MNAIPVRVRVHDQWDEVEFEVNPVATIADLKARALAAASVDRAADEYLIKFRGAELDESATVGSAGIVPNAGLIVLRRRRVPVR